MSGGRVPAARRQPPGEGGAGAEGLAPLGHISNIYIYIYRYIAILAILVIHIYS